MFDWLNKLLTDVLGTQVIKGGPGKPTEEYIEGGWLNDVRGKIGNIMGRKEPKMVSPLPDYEPVNLPTQTPTPTPRQLTPTPTQTPTPIPTKMPIPQPTPTLIPNIQHPYLSLLEQYFLPEDINRASNVIFGESSNLPNYVNINEIQQRRLVDEAMLRSLLNQYGNIDVGLAQHNLGTPVGDALLDYMSGLGLNLGDLLTPEYSIRLMADKLYGRVPNILPGWSQWKTPYATEEVNY